MTTRTISRPESKISPLRQQKKNLKKTLLGTNGNN